jgi:hypothetical protein
VSVGRVVRQFARARSALPLAPRRDHMALRPSARASGVPAKRPSTFSCQRWVPIMG